MTSFGDMAPGERFRAWDIEQYPILYKVEDGSVRMEDIPRFRFNPLPADFDVYPVPDD